MIFCDWHNLLNRGVFPNKDKIIENPDYLSHVTLTMILNLTSKFGASKHNPMVLCCDSKPTWRHEFYTQNCRNFPEYAVKEGYKGKSLDGFQIYKGDRIKDDIIPWDRIEEINNDILESLKHNSDFHVVKVPNCEADDIIAVLAKKCANEKRQCNIVSTDGDFVQCQTQEVNIYNPIKSMFVPETNVEEYKTLHFLLAGDDNIKNVKRGLGEKTVLKLLPRLDEELQINPEMRARYEFNKSLIDFDRIPDYITESILEEWKLHEGKFTYNAQNLIKMFRKYSLNAIGERVMDFKLSDNKKTTELNSYHERMKHVESWSDNMLENFF